MELRALDDMELANIVIFRNASFGPNEHQACEASVVNRDCFVPMLIGGSRSLCYHLQATLKPGVTIVISPILSLIQDRIIMLNLEHGIPSTFLTSQQTASQAATVMAELRQGLAFSAIFSQALFWIIFRSGKKSLQWNSNPRQFIELDINFTVLWLLMFGHDFRPDYRRLGCLKQSFPNVPITALTATATRPDHRHNFSIDVIIQ
ncbi:hypothetical protein MLD38_017813 [Melastoma candidum]|uniref:Uncharacterized protein n=1 Tax=Melastoma candidum TaxID=119954 RepID=A0ACB9QRW6_9MYRT|nr:hypothetical protein MLD38_017813 [Melastoma candidum]